MTGPSARAATGKKETEIHADLYGPFDYRRAGLAAAKIESDIRGGTFCLAGWLPDQSMFFGSLAGEFLLYMKKRADEGLIAHNN